MKENKINLFFAMVAALGMVFATDGLRADSFFANLESSLEFERRKTEDVESEIIRELYDKHDIPHPEHIRLDMNKLAVAEWEEGRYKFMQISPAAPGWTWEHTFLVFKREADTLSFLGIVDFKKHKYGPPSVAFVQIGGEDFLVFKPIGMSGTGVLQYFNDWRLLDEDDIKPVLLVLVEGHVMGWGNPFNRAFQSVNLMVTEEKKSIGIAYIYKALYWPPWQHEEGSSTLTTHPGAYWQWDSNSKKFVHDKHCSPSTEEQLFGIFYHGTDGVVADNLLGFKSMELNDDTVKWLHLLEKRSTKEENKEALRGILGETYEEDYFEGKDMFW